MKHVIIWAATRTSSTNLCLALGAESEPFQAGPPASRLHWAYRAWQKRKTTIPIMNLCASHKSFKHIPEHFDDGFNAEIAKISTRLGYRHLHLVRLNELDRLISNDIAGQLNAWNTNDARAKFAEIKAGTRRLNLLDVPRLVQNSRRVIEAWDAVDAYLAPVLLVTYEELTIRDEVRRSHVLNRIDRFLELSMTEAIALAEACVAGGQNTAQVRDAVPNVAELRNRLMTEGVL
jgi:hypothetical protein